MQHSRMVMMTMMNQVMMNQEMTSARYVPQFRAMKVTKVRVGGRSGGCRTRGRYDQSQ